MGDRTNRREDRDVYGELPERDINATKLVTFKTLPGVGDRVGYGYAGVNFVDALEANGYRVRFNDPDGSIVSLNFCQPDYYDFYPELYNIGYTPWESTVIPERWLPLIERMDEFWTTSPQCATWFLNNGVTTRIRVVPHGIEPIWEPTSRVVDDVFKFLHVGEPTNRKGGEMVFNAFRAAFPNNDDVRLTFKASGRVDARNNGDGSRNILAADSRVSFILDSLELEDLVKLYQSHHAMVYPSNGEGFGFIPFQAAATGMPTAATKWWCSYGSYLTHEIDYTMVDANHKIHLGRWAQPDFDDVVSIMRDMYENYDSLHAIAMDKARKLHKDYSWDEIARDAMRDVPQARFRCLINDGIAPINYGDYELRTALRIGTDISEEDAIKFAKKFPLITYIK